MTTKEETLRRIQVMQAWCDGEPLQHRAHGETIWMDNDRPDFDWWHVDYRIAPKPKRKIKLTAWVDRSNGMMMLSDDTIDYSEAFYRAPWLDGEVEVDD